MGPVVMIGTVISGVAGAIMGAILCTMVAIIAKPMNLGLCLNIAVGAVGGSLTAMLVNHAAPNFGIAMAATVIGSVGPMIAIGLYLNARAR